VPVSDLVPDGIFFDHLANKRFPAGAFIRSEQEMDYLEEPDVFHDVFGHVPMHAHKVFGDFLQHYGAVCARVQDKDVLEKIGRLFWYTVEFGLIRQNGKVKVYGSGVISSHGECENVIRGGCEVRDFTLGQFFDVWGVRFTKDCIGGYCTKGNDKLRVFSDGKPVTGDPTNLVLSSHQVIAVVFGPVQSTPTIRTTYQFDD